MKSLIAFSPILLLFSCSNEIEEITDPITGVVLKKYEYYNDDSGQKIKDGTYTEWNSDGSIKWTCNYEDGKLEGEEIVYIKGDSIIYNNYKNDLKEGRCRIEYKGIITRDLNYSEGKLNGKQQYFYPDGKLNIEGFMKDNITSDTWKHYNQKGHNIATFTYNENGTPNELIGKWTQENDEGKEVYYLFNEKGIGEFHSPLFKYSKDPVLQLEGFYQLGTNLVLQDGVNIISMKILTFEKNRMKVIYNDGDIETYAKD